MAALQDTKMTSTSYLLRDIARQTWQKEESFQEGMERQDMFCRSDKADFDPCYKADWKTIKKDQITELRRYPITNYIHIHRTRKKELFREGIKRKNVFGRIDADFDPCYKADWRTEEEELLMRELKRDILEDLFLREQVIRMSRESESLKMVRREKCKLNMIPNRCLRKSPELESLKKERESSISIDLFLREECLGISSKLECIKKIRTEKYTFSTLLESCSHMFRKLEWIKEIKELMLCMETTDEAKALDEERKMNCLRMIFVYFAVLLLRLNILSTRNTRYVLQWSDKAVLLVLWTCGDVERNPGPVNTKRLTRSEILRKFRRSVQLLLLKFIYGEREMPKNPFSRPPPGWIDFGPDVKFTNISNVKSGEEQIFNKMLRLMEMEPILLPNDLIDVLEHYKTLNERPNEEASKASKAAIELWILEKEIVQFLPKISEYLEKTDTPHEEIQKVFQLSAWKVRKFPLSLCDSYRSGPGDENWSEGNELPSCKAILDTNGTDNELPNFSTKKKRPVANSVEDADESQGISETKRFKRNKDGPEKCITNEQQNQDLHGEYQSGSVNDTEGDIDAQLSFEVATDGNSVQNLRIPDSEDELLKKCKSNQQHSMDMQGEYQSLNSEGSMDGTAHAGLVVLQSSMEVPTYGKTLDLLQSLNDEDEELRKGKDSALGTEGIKFMITDMYQKKCPVANSVEDADEAQEILETKRFTRNKDGPEKCTANEQQNQYLHGEYQSGSGNDTEGDLNVQPSSEIPTDENMVQNSRIPDTEDELLIMKKCKSNQQQSMDIHGEYQSLDSKGSVDDTARLVVVQSSMEVPTDGKTIDLLQSINDEDEDLSKGKDNGHGAEGITLMITDMYQVPLVSMFLRMYLEDKSIDHPSKEIVDLCLQILNRVFPQNS